MKRKGSHQRVWTKGAVGEFIKQLLCAPDNAKETATRDSSLVKCKEKYSGPLPC